MFLGFLSALLVIGTLASILLVMFGLLAARVFFRYILPILLILLAIRVIFAGLMLLFNPHFWLFVGGVALVIWLLGKFRA
ncbi:hypothetical protein [Lactococcus kimchii]|uniref:hypothetical protein n=1 Tax=Lactococcus sp. S-13 TaxID=2507158 RepID=UPI001022DD25|nr:hypothetical protein [Lactococcus sp. S-13]RZI49550.1 hypothetical protein EQJ87_09025 [Lactococcus sp. S-13]